MSIKRVILRSPSIDNPIDDFLQVMVDGIYVGLVFLSSSGRWSAMHLGQSVKIPGRNPDMETALGALLVKALGYSIVESEGKR